MSVFKSGQKVKIYNNKLSGDLFLEGVATLDYCVSLQPGAPFEMWFVKFSGERSVLRRVNKNQAEGQK